MKVSHCSTRAGGCGDNSAGGGDDSSFVGWLGHSLSTLCTSLEQPLLCQQDALIEELR